MFSLINHVSKTIEKQDIRKLSYKEVIAKCAKIQVGSKVRLTIQRPVLLLDSDELKQEFIAATKENPVKVSRSNCN